MRIEIRDPNAMDRNTPLTVMLSGKPVTELVMVGHDDVLDLRFEVEAGTKLSIAVDDKTLVDQKCPESEYEYRIRATSGLQKGVDVHKDRAEIPHDRQA